MTSNLNIQTVPKEQKVQVILRIRPSHTREDPANFLTVEDPYTVLLNRPGSLTFMRFNSIFSGEQPGQSPQAQLYGSLLESVKSVTQGIDTTIFAYGQTGAGKTHTIFGSIPEGSQTSQAFLDRLNSESKGVLPRALETLFNHRAKTRDSRISVSFYQIYNEKVYDLLALQAESLAIKECNGGELEIMGLTIFEVVSVKEALRYLSEGLRNRVTRETAMNSQSSRSHIVFHIHHERLITQSEPDDYDVIISHLRIIDLAGSEKFNINPSLSSSERELRLLELKSINGSLSQLGHCISALTSSSRSHIPFRSSKLTRILKDSFLGVGKIRLIVCVSPSITYANQTLSTLQFADRVKKATFERTSPTKEKRQTVPYEEHSKVLLELEQQRSKRKQLENMVRSSGVVAQLLTKISRLQKQLAEFRAKQKGVSILAKRLKPADVASPMKANFPRKSPSGKIVGILGRQPNNRNQKPIINSSTNFDSRSKASFDELLDSPQTPTVYRPKRAHIKTHSQLSWARPPQQTEGTFDEQFEERVFSHIQQMSKSYNIQRARTHQYKQSLK